MAVEGGVETSSVNSVAGKDLSLEAAGGQLEMVGGGGLSVEGGFTGGSEGVKISSYADLSLASQAGSVSNFFIVYCTLYSSCMLYPPSPTPLSFSI